MPIDPQALKSRYLNLPGEMSLREALRHLVASRRGGQPSWRLLVSLGDGRWATATFDQLYTLARKDRRFLDRALQDLGVLLPATVVDEQTMGTAKARKLAKTSPGSLIVVTRDKSLVGILYMPLRASGAVTKKEISHFLESESPAGRDPLSDSSRRTVRRYTDVSCPDRVALETRRFSVVVRLTVERPPDDFASRSFDVLSLEEPVRVELRAPDFEVLNDREQEIRLLPDQDSPPVVFFLRPRQVGNQRLELEFFQKTAPLGMVSLPVEVTKDPISWRSTEASLDLPVYNSSIPPPDFVLRILWARDSQGQSLSFSLLRHGGAGWDEFPPVRFIEDPAEYARRLFSRMADLAAGAAPAKEIQRELRKKGQNLWEVLPPRLRELYARERDGWQNRSLLIVSDEPHIPWEMIWPWDQDWQDEEPWCMTLRLSRWLRRDGLGTGNSGAPDLLPLRSLACLASGEIGLPSAVAEREFLHDLARRHQFEDLSPPVFNRPSTMDLLDQGGYDWLHFAVHGTFSDAAPDQESALRLEDLTYLTPEDFVGPEITRHLRQRRPAFVLNSCGAARQGWGLVGLGGWASRLISLGAGMFLGTLWPVRDASALALIQELYKRLLAGEAVAEALRQARLAIRNPDDDPSWLAYSLYGHPNARCTAPTVQLPASARSA